jgi:protein tyrosine phosphatase
MCQKATYPLNTFYNKFNDVLPYDHNVVYAKETYVNASRVKFSGCSNEYIATQMPNAYTIHHFWKMIWHEKSNFIVNLVPENEEPSSNLYYPGMGETYDEQGVHVAPVASECLLYDNKKIGQYRLFKLTVNSETEMRDVHMFHFTSWIDKSAPPSPFSFQKFIHDLDESMETFASNDTPVGPIVVHCTAGIGRTGTFITIHSILSEMSHTVVASKYRPSESEITMVLTKSFPDPSCSVETRISDLRSQRFGSVQVCDQYQFCFVMVHVELVRIQELYFMVGSSESNGSLGVLSKESDGSLYDSNDHLEIYAGDSTGSIGSGIHDILKKPVSSNGPEESN